MNIVDKIKHLFYPHHSNNHKAKILHPETILLFAILILVVQIIISNLPKLGFKVLGYAADISVDDVIKLTNQKRAENGLEPLTYNSQLSGAAMAKGNHMIANDYWAHTSPDGTTPWKFFSDAGYKYKYAGENLARDFSNAPTAVDAWMASPSHRENILASKYREIGIAVVEGDLSGSDTTIIVQLFGTQYLDTAPAIPIASANTSQAIVENQIKPTATSYPPTPTVIKAPASVTVLPTLTSPNTLTSSRSEMRVLISPFQTTRGVSLGVTALLIVVMTIDAIIVHKRNIPRVGGRTIAHMAFLIMVLAIVIIAQVGQVL